jgi:hypothetical protein
MVEMNTGIAAQMALVQQKAALGMLKSTANAEKQLADVISQTVNASGRGQIVNITA